MNDLFINFIDLFVLVTSFVVVISIIASWIPSMRQLPLVEPVIGVADVILTPVRKIIPPRNGLDWSPLITIFGLQLVQVGAHNLLK